MLHRLRNRLEKLDQKVSAPAVLVSDTDAHERLRAAIAAEFGVSGRDVWRNGSPARCLLHRVCDGIATASEVSQFNRLAEVPYFEGHTFSTADYLRALSKIFREF
jgi:hypothetical protein